MDLDISNIFNIFALLPTEGKEVNKFFFVNLDILENLFVINR